MEKKASISAVSATASADALGPSIPAPVANALAAYEKISKLRAFDAEDVLQARNGLCEALFRFILGSPHEAAAVDIDSRLWRMVFYEPLGNYRKQVQSRPGKPAPTAMVQIILSGIGLYSTLIDTVAQQFGLDKDSTLPLMAELFASSPGPATLMAGKTSPTIKDLANAAIDEASVRLMIYRMIINLGDLYRYAAQYCPKEASTAIGLSFIKTQALKPSSKAPAVIDLNLALEVYSKAQDFVPDHGNAYNQAAVVSSMLEDEAGDAKASLRTLFLYVTALIARDGFGKLASSNLKAYVRKDRGPAKSPLAVFSQLARKKLDDFDSSLQAPPSQDIALGVSLEMPVGEADPLEWIYASCIMRYWLGSRTLARALLNGVFAALRQCSKDGSPSLHEGHLIAMALAVDQLDTAADRQAVVDADFPDAVHPVAGWQRLVRPYLGFTPDSPETMLESAIQKGVSGEDFEMDFHGDEKNAAYLTEDEDDLRDGPLPRSPLPASPSQSARQMPKQQEELSKSLLAQLLSSTSSHVAAGLASSQPAQPRSIPSSQDVQVIASATSFASVSASQPAKPLLQFQFKPVAVKVTSTPIPTPRNLDTMSELVQHLPDLSHRILTVEGGIPFSDDSRIYVSRILFNQQERAAIAKRYNSQPPQQQQLPPQ